MTWVCFPRASVRFEREPAARASSPRVTRRFCADCGAQIAMDYEGSHTLDIALGTLDEPGLVTVRENIWSSRRLRLVKGFDQDLPSFERFRDEE